MRFLIWSIDGDQSDLRCGHIHGDKFISKLYYFHKKIHYFFSDAGTHSKSRIFTILNSTF